MADNSHPDPPPAVVDYVAEHAPELDPDPTRVGRFVV
jgi:hypothetical protein